MALPFIPRRFRRPPLNPTGLAGWWGLDGTLVDAGVNNRLGVVAGTGPIFYVGGIAHGVDSVQRLAVQFNGTNWIQVSSSKILSGQNNWTVSSWLNTAANSVSVGRPIYSERAPTGNDVFGLQCLDTTSNHQAYFVIRDDAGTLLFVRGTKVIDDGKWHHIGATKSGSTILLYVDGVQDGGSSGNWSGTNTFTNSIVSLIGNDIVTTTGTNGFIDDVRLWTYTLSAAEMFALSREPYQPVIDVEKIPFGGPSVAAGAFFFRKTLSPIGTRTGSRQSQAA